MSDVNLEEMLSVGGKTNSLGKVDAVIDMVLQNNDLLEELYMCMFSLDSWVRMRAADAFEKVCREHPRWIEPYIDRLQKELSGRNQQSSIKWHMAQIYTEVNLTESQKKKAIQWLKDILSSTDIDWIVAANSMKTLAFFAEKGDVSRDTLVRYVTIQQRHKSNAVVKRVTNLLEKETRRKIIKNNINIL